MTLKSNLFAGDARLEACAATNASHVTVGAIGPHVKKIQVALGVLDDAVIDSGELDSSRYGASTARAVLAFKTKRGIINRSYQSTADNIVGIMTVKALDDELLKQQVQMQASSKQSCPRICVCGAGQSKSSLLAALTSKAQSGAQLDIAAQMRRAVV